MDFSLWHTPRAGTGCLVTAGAPGAFWVLRGLNSSREAEVRFLTDSKLKTDNRKQSKDTHSIFFFLRENEKNILSVWVQKRRFLDQQLVTAYDWWAGEAGAVCACLSVCTHMACTLEWLPFFQAHGKLECDYRIQDVRSMSS